MANIAVKYEKNPHQESFHADIKHKFLHLSSGFGGGKSYSLVMKALHLSYLNRPYGGGVVVPSIPDYKKDLLPIFQDILDENNVKYKYHQTDKWFRFPWSKGKLQVATAEKPLRGPNWAFACLNEVTLITWERYKETIGRVRVKNAPYPQIASSGTPESDVHWLYDKFIEDPLPNSSIIYGDTRDNARNLNPDYIKTLEDSYDTTWLDAYLRGLFVPLVTNRFYYAYDPKKNDDSNLAYDPAEKHVHFSLDFNVDPMCGTMWHMKPVLDGRGNQRVHIDGRLMYELQAVDQIEMGGPSGANTQKMCDAMKARGMHPYNTTIYPDPAGRARSTKGTSDIEILRRNGFTDIRFKNKAPDMRNRQLAVNNLLDKGLIKINNKTCRGLKRDFEAVEQDVASLQKVKKNPKLTHFSDGADYLIDVLFPLSGKKPPSRVVKFR